MVQYLYQCPMSSSAAEASSKMSLNKTNTNKRVELLKAAEASDVEKLVDIIGKKKSDQNEVVDAIAEFSKSQMDEFWQNIYSICTSTLLKEQDGEQSDEVEESIHKVLKCASSLALSTLTVLQANKPSEDDEEVINSSIVAPQVAPQALQEVTTILHGVFPTLNDKWQPLKNQLCRLFETWWISQLDGKEDIVANTMTYLLTRCTEPNSAQTDVARLWGVHTMFALIDFKLDSASPVILLLQQCSHHPQFISNAQGAKFLDFILTLDPNLTDTLHQTIKIHLPSTPKSWHVKYGEIYLRAWRKASDAMRQKLEEDCIQDLMYRAVHAQRGGVNSIASALFRLLSYLHKQKTQRGVEAMLVRLYEPILWRSLRVANSDVRMNAATLMFDVFPLQDPALLHEQADTALQRQFDIMHSLMTDPVPEVRVRAIMGTGNIINLYWELIPTQVIQCFVTTLIQDLVHDITSTSVREAVIKVMFGLCDNHLCIPLLKKILPELHDFVHDTSEKVRIAMFDLLLKVKGLRGIKFWNIVPVEHILARLELDSPPIIRRVMKLISSSFVPISQPPSQQVERCLTLITSNRNAARQFFLNLPKSLGAVDTSNYILVLCRYALESTRHMVRSQDSRLQTEDKNRDEDDSDEATVSKKSRVKRAGKRKGYLNEGTPKDSDENAETADSVTETDSDSQESPTEKIGTDESSDQGHEDFLSDVNLLSGLMEAVYLMYTVISPQLREPEHAQLKEGLSKKLCITVRELLSVSQNNLLDNALIALAGHLPSRALPMVSQKLMNRLMQSNQDVDQCSLAVKSLIQWGRADDLIEMVQEILQDKFQEDGSKTNSKDKNPKKKSVAFTTEKSKPDFDQAANIIVAMLSLAECRLILQRNHRDSLRSLADHLKCVFDVFRNDLSYDESDGNAAVMDASKRECSMQAFSVYLRVSAFLSMGSAGCSKDDRRYMKLAMVLALELAIPNLLSGKGEETKKMAVQIIEKVIRASNGLLMVGSFTSESLDEVMEICNSVLKTAQALPPSLIESALSLIYQFTQLRTGSDSKEQQQQHSHSQDQSSLPTANKKEVVLTCLTEALKSVSLLEDRRSQADNTSCSIVGEIIQAMTTLRVDPEVRDRTMSVTADSLIQYLKSCSKKEIIDVEGEKLPAFITSVIGTVKRKSFNRSSLLEEMIVHLGSDSVDIHSIHGIASIVHRLRIKDRKASADLALEEAVKEALSKITVGCMDEDVFRDMKLQVENVIKSWTSTSADEQHTEVTTS